VKCKVNLYDFVLESIIDLGQYLCMIYVEQLE